MRNFEANINLALKGKPQVVGGLREVEGAMQKLSSTKVITTFDKQGIATGTQIANAFKVINEETGRASSQMGDFEKALRRVVVVAPIWMAFRAGLQFFTQGVQQGIKYLVDFEKEMMKIKQILPNAFTASGISKFREEFEKLSKETGRPPAAIAQMFTVFARAGADATTAMAGATAAVRLQEVAMSDSVDIVNALALAYKLQGSSLSDNLSPAEKFLQMESALYAMSLKNRVTVEDLSKQYLNFASGAKALNLTFNETVALLGTLNSQGVQNITQLKTAMIRTLTDSNKIAKELHINIAPDTKPLELFIKVLEKFKSVSEAKGNLTPFQALGELYGKGGGRSATALIKTLSDAIEELKKNLGTLKFPSDSVNAFKASLDNVRSSLPEQIKFFENFKNLVFESFIIGITGGRDFAESIKIVNKLLLDAIPIMKDYGEILRGLGVAWGTLGTMIIYDDNTKQIKKAADAEKELGDRILAAQKGQMAYKDILILVGDLTSGLATLSINKSYEPIRAQLKYQAKELGDIYTTNKAIADAEKKGKLDKEAANITLQERLKLNKQEEKIIDSILIKSGIKTEEERLKRKIAILAVDKEIVSAEERRTQIEIAQNQLLDVQLSKLKKQEDALVDIVDKYEQGTWEEKKEIETAMSLAQLSPKTFGEEATHKYNWGKDLEIIKKFWSSGLFSPEQKEAFNREKIKASPLMAWGAGDIERERTALEEEIKIKDRAREREKVTGGLPQSVISAIFNANFTVTGGFTKANLMDMLSEAKGQAEKSPYYLGDVDLTWETFIKSPKGKKTLDEHIENY
jgi:TP901 family phage tail tape measure protein